VPTVPAWMRPTDEKKFDSLLVKRPPLARRAKPCKAKQSARENAATNRNFMFFYCRAETQGRRGGKLLKEDWIWKCNLSDLKIYAKTLSNPAPLRETYSGSPFTARTMPSFIRALPKFSR